MAILHVMTVDHTHPDPVKDARGCYKRGDIISVKEDTAHDGDIVKNPIALGRFLVKVTGLTKAQAEKYMESHMDNTDPENPVVLTRRLRKVNLDGIPAQIMSTLNSNRYVEVSLAQIGNYLINKTTGDPD